MALLIFLARPARTWFVASDFWLIANDSLYFAILFTGWSGTLVGAGECQRSRSSGHPPLLQRLRRLFGYDLQVEQRANGCRVDTIEHFLEQIETLFLVFNQRIFLTIA